MRLTLTSGKNNVVLAETNLWLLARKMAVRFGSH